MAEGCPTPGKLEFAIESNEIRGPFNLSETLLSGQTDGAGWFEVDGAFWDAEKIDLQFIKYIVRQIGTTDRPALNVTIVGINALQSKTAIDAKAYLTRILRLNDDLERFYSEFKNDRLAKTFPHHIGLRLMLASNPFESLISSISSQNASIKRWHRLVQLIKERFGQKITFADGSNFYTFPEARALSKATRSRLAVCRPGYRAEYILNVARLVAEGNLDLTALSNMSYEDARSTLLEVCGIGPKVADCFLLYGLGFTRAAPVDVWVHRIAQRLYRKHMTVKQTETFLQDRFGRWAGYAALYLFHYARTCSGRVR